MSMIEATRAVNAPFANKKILRKAFQRLSKRPEMEALKTAGALYLESTPDEGNLAALLKLLPQADSSDVPYWDSFTERLQADFTAGQTVSLEGWVLSRTECRLYGLLHLLTQ